MMKNLPRSGKHQHHHSHHKHSHHSHNHGTDGSRKATRSHSSSNVLEFDEKNSSNVIEQPLHQKRSAAGPRKNSAEKPCNRHLQKSFSDGKLVEDEQNLNGSAAVSNTQVKPQKAVKFLQTLPPPPSAAGQQIAQSEDEVSDRDLPELAPIDIQDYQRKGEITSLPSLTKISIKNDSR